MACRGADICSCSQADQSIRPTTGGASSSQYTCSKSSGTSKGPGPCNSATNTHPSHSHFFPDSACCSPTFRKRACSCTTDTRASICDWNGMAHQEISGSSHGMGNNSLELSRLTFGLGDEEH